jgi:hypothetical protein
MGNAYNSASLLVTPNGYKASKIYSAKPTDGTGDLAFSRASTAMRRNSAGLWEEVASNVPRLQYPVGGGCPSWLFEPQATNVITYANDLSNAVWDKSFCSVAYQSSSYFASLNEAVVSNITNTLYRGISSNSNGTWAFSIVLKKTDADIVQVDIPNGSATGAGGKFWFTFSTETITQGNGTTTLIEENNGNYRFQCIMNIVSFGSHALYITPTTTAGGNTLDSGKGCIFNHAQFETGSVATSPIITAGSAVTRLADVSTTTGKSALIGQTEGTIFIEFDSVINASGVQGLLFIAVDGNNYIGIYIVGGNIIFEIITAGVGIFSRSIAYANGKAAITYNVNSMAAFFNGAKVGVTDISGTPPNTSRIYLGSYDGGASARGNVKPAILYKTALSDSEAIELTTI